MTRDFVPGLWYVYPAHKRNDLVPMPFVLLLVSIIIVGIILTKIDRHSPRGKQLLIYFYLAIAMVSLMRGVWLSAVLFSIFALWNWAALQQIQGNTRTFFQTDAKKTHRKKANLPRGCPPDCSGQDLTGQNLQAVNLNGANLEGANLFVADLRQANLGGANLEKVDLGGAKLEGADLRRARLAGADLRGAKYDGDTIWPANFDPKRAGAVRTDQV